MCLCPCPCLPHALSCTHTHTQIHNTHSLCLCLSLPPPSLCFPLLLALPALVEDNGWRLHLFVSVICTERRPNSKEEVREGTACVRASMREV